MLLTKPAPPPPFAEDSQGVVRIGGTRVSLETVISAFKSGSSCEEIVFQFPCLGLADVYSTINYYLSHQSEIEDYLDERGQSAAKIREKLGDICDSRGIREKLLKRRARNDNAS